MPSSRTEYFREWGRKRRAANRDKIREYARERHRRLNLPAPTRPCPDVCESCSRPPGKRSLNLDHDHVTNKFRGWLCSRCNMALGFLGDNLEAVEKMADYLKRHLS